MKYDLMDVLVFSAAFFATAFIGATGITACVSLESKCRRIEKRTRELQGLTVHK